MMPEVSDCRPVVRVYDVSGVAVVILKTIGIPQKVRDPGNGAP